MGIRLLNCGRSPRGVPEEQRPRRPLLPVVRERTAGNVRLQFCPFGQICGRRRRHPRGLLARLSRQLPLHSGQAGIARTAPCPPAVGIRPFPPGRLCGGGWRLSGSVCLWATHMPLPRGAPMVTRVPSWRAQRGSFRAVSQHCLSTHRLSVGVHGPCLVEVAHSRCDHT